MLYVRFWVKESVAMDALNAGVQSDFRQLLICINFNYGVIILEFFPRYYHEFLDVRILVLTLVSQVLPAEVDFLL